MSHDMRPPSRGCQNTPAANMSQMAASMSLLTQVILPLERCGNIVEVTLTECSQARGCPLFRQVQALFGAHRIVANVTKCVSKNQIKGVRMTLGVFKSVAAKRKYDLVIMTRHDIIWAQPITLWR